MTILCWRGLALWVIGYPEAALADADQALKDAREIGQAVTLMAALLTISLTHLCCRSYDTANVLVDELVALANEKGASLWRASGMSRKGCLLAAVGEASNAVQMVTSAITALRSTGSTVLVPLYLANLANAYAEIGQHDAALRCIYEAITAAETTKERWCEAEIHRIAGEIALRSPEPDMPKAEAYFYRALNIARAQQAKSWELRAAMSMAQLWRDQGGRDAARELLAPLYGWFTEGFDTPDLKQARALLDELA